jgi:dTDP-4-dehydrorhamnose reductase
MCDVDVTETRVLVLGGTGMLGSMVCDVLRKNKNITLYATTRLPQVLSKKVEGLEWVFLDINNQNQEALMIELDEKLADKHYVINCIGMTKPFAHDGNRNEILRAIRNNSIFPHVLDEVAKICNVKVIQIATDCVFSGATGNYKENSKHDATDVYGKTKSLGEVISDNMFNMRCSIIGPELKNPTNYLMEWFLNQDKDAQCNGFANHFWNGVTTLHFAKVCEGIIKNNVWRLGQTTHHLVPSSKMSKYDMLRSFADLFGRKDIQINKTDAGIVVDRTLDTDSNEFNNYLWKLAEYNNPPSVKQMIEELAEYDYGMEIIK